MCNQERHSLSLSTESTRKERYVEHKTVKVSYYLAQYPVFKTTQSVFTLYIPSRPVQSNTVSTSLGSIQPYAAINARRLLVHIFSLSLLSILSDDDISVGVRPLRALLVGERIVQFEI